MTKNQIFGPDLPKLGLNRAQTGKNVVLKSRDRYDIVSIYKYYQLTLFLVLIGSVTKSQTFGPDWPKPGLNRAQTGKNVVLKSRDLYDIVSTYK